MIIWSDENVKKYVFNLNCINQGYQMIASSHGKATQQNEETCIGCNQMFIANDSSMNGTWNTYL